RADDAYATMFGENLPDYGAIAMLVQGQDYAPVGATVLLDAEFARVPFFVRPGSAVPAGYAVGQPNGKLRADEPGESRNPLAYNAAMNQRLGAAAGTTPRDAFA